MTRSTPADVVIRPLVEADVVAANDVSWEALEEVGRQFGFAMDERNAAGVAYAQSRIRHIAMNDPDGSVVAEQDGQVVGVGLAIRRGSLWFLSLLAVRGDLQGGGVGRRLLEATLDYAKPCPSAMICASPDPKALRRYGRAGFALHAGYEAAGIADRGELPGGLGTREGDWDRDADLVEQLIKDCRGEPYGPDLGWCRRRGMRLIVRDGGGPGARAAALLRGGHVETLAAASEEAAAQVLWGAMAESSGEVTIGYLRNDQQWAIEVALAARLSLKLTDTLCVRGLTPSSRYVPSGLWG